MCYLFITMLLYNSPLGGDQLTDFKSSQDVGDRVKIRNFVGCKQC